MGRHTSSQDDCRASPADGRPRRRRARTRRRARRRSAAWAIPAGIVLGAMLIGGGAAFAYWQDTRPPVAADHAVDAADPLEAASERPGASSSRSPSPSVGSSASASPSASSSPSSGAGIIAVPATGPGTFTTAQADGTTVGHGSRVRRYKVLVEDGIDISASRAAAEVSAILADTRGWTRDGVNSFRLVNSGPYDFVVKIATPGTVDRICGVAGLLTRGEVNCSVGQDVVVNLKRWVLGSPQFDGPIDEYRALIVNHEVGHRIGQGHEGCPGPGEPAPAMMQQIKGLHGCVANAWPYDRSGRYLGGPAVA